MPNNVIKQVLILKEKHGNTCYDVSTEGRLHAVALYIINQRFSGKNMDMYFDNEPPAKPECSVTQEQAEAMPDTDIIKQAVLDTWKRYKLSLASYENNQWEKELIQQAIIDKDGKLAYRILCQRQDIEYEGVEIVPVIDI